VQLLLSDGVTYSIVVCAAIGMDCAENTIPLLLFMGRCLVMAVCFDCTILAILVNMPHFSILKAARPE
jgi:hypothetical protein